MALNPFHQHIFTVIVSNQRDMFAAGNRTCRQFHILFHILTCRQISEVKRLLLQASG